MKPEIAKLWSESLRSRRFLQGTHALRRRTIETNTHQFCCLGVLCELAVEAGVIEPGRFGEEGQSASDYTSYGGGRGSCCAIPDEVLKWSGVKEASGCFLPDAGDEVAVTSLAEMNDSGRTFLEIANFIDANVDAL